MKHTDGTGTTKKMDDEGGFLIPKELIFGGFMSFPVPHKDYRVLFYYLSRILSRLSLMFLRAEIKISPYGMTTERRYVKGMVDHEEWGEVIRNLLEYKNV